jgi:hypothetical protein
MRLSIRCTALLLSAVLSLSPLPAQTAAGLSKQDLQELAHYTLTMENITHFIQALPDLLVLATAHPDLRSTLDINPAYYGLTETDHRLAAHPEIVAILAQHGLAPHEFNLVAATWFSSTEAYVNPTNVAFREQHKAEIEALVISTIERRPVQGKP